MQPAHNVEEEWNFGKKEADKARLTPQQAELERLKQEMLAEARQRMTQQPQSAPVAMKQPTPSPTKPATPAQKVSVASVQLAPSLAKAPPAAAATAAPFSRPPGTSPLPAKAPPRPAVTTAAAPKPPAPIVKPTPASSPEPSDAPFSQQVAAMSDEGIEAHVQSLGLKGQEAARVVAQMTSLREVMQQNAPPKPAAARHPTPTPATSTQGPIAAKTVHQQAMGARPPVAFQRPSPGGAPPPASSHLAPLQPHAPWPPQGLRPGPLMLNGRPPHPALSRPPYAPPVPPLKRQRTDAYPSPAPGPMRQLPVSMLHGKGVRPPAQPALVRGRYPTALVPNVNRSVPFMVPTLRNPYHR